MKGGLKDTLAVRMRLAPTQIFCLATPRTLVALRKCWVHHWDLKANRTIVSWNRGLSAKRACGTPQAKPGKR
jgi:hypothetical protein